MNDEIGNIKKIKAIRFKRTVFCHATETIIKNGYVKTSEGLFNQKGIAVYVTLLDEVTVEKKAAKKANEHGITVSRYGKKREVFKLELDLKKCLDLTDDKRLKELGLERKDILYPKKKTTQEIGVKAREFLFEAIIFPTLEGNAIVVFRDILGTIEEREKKVKIIKPNQVNLEYWLEKKKERRSRSKKKSKG